MNHDPQQKFDFAAMAASPDHRDWPQLIRVYRAVEADEKQNSPAGRREMLRTIVQAIASHHQRRDDPDLVATILVDLEDKDTELLEALAAIAKLAVGRTTWASAFNADGSKKRAE
jgi:hypothetical protein